MPNVDHAVIDRAKLEGYLRSEGHPVGRFKARFFASLGFTAHNWRDLDAALRSHHLSESATPGPVEAFGQSFTTLMTDLAKHSGLAWDCILGAELVRHDKPDREVYQSAADFLDLEPAEVMMVTAHAGDLRAAKGVGLRTAFVVRPLEFGPSGKPDLTADSAVDISAKDFNDLASQLGA